MKKYVGIILGSILLSAYCQTTSATDPDRLKFGALHFGMPLSEARAIPNMQWSVIDQNATTSRPYVIKGKDAVTIATVTFDAEIGSRYLGTALWKLEARDAVKNAAACHDRSVAVAVELERRIGMFHHLGNVIEGEALINIGKESQAKITAAEKLRPLDPEQALPKDPQDYWFHTRHDDEGDGDLDLDVKAHYERDAYRSCEITVRMEGYEPPPAELGVVFDEARLIAKPTIAYRNRTLRMIGVPDKALHFMMSCRISASTGKIDVCVSGPAGANIDPYRKLASSWAIRHQLKLNNPQADDKRLFDIDVPITMGPDDVRAVDVSTGRMLERAQILVTHGIGSNTDDVYTDEMRRLKIGADITLLCKVQEDGSVLCDIKPSTTSPSKAFTDAAIQLGERLEVRTQLRDGTVAIGGLFEQLIKFAPK